jgi:ribosomal protein S18 acetylase RimI-like enzyme
MPVTLRPVGPSDQAFLFALYCSTREEEVASWGWNDAQREAFLRMQFNAQQQHYRAQDLPTEQQIICREGRSIGWIATINDQQVQWLADIALLPDQRNNGLGTALIRDLLAAAAKAGQAVRLHVLHGNRAIRLYQRLGFQAIADNGLHIQMEWRPHIQPQAESIESQSG